MKEEEISKISDEALIVLCEESKIVGHPLGVELIKRFKSKNKAIINALKYFKDIENLTDKIIKE